MAMVEIRDVSTDLAEAFRRGSMQWPRCGGCPAGASLLSAGARRGDGGGAPGFGSSSPKRLMYLGLHVEAAGQVALAEFAEHCQLVP